MDNKRRNACGEGDRVVIIGASGHARVIADIVSSCGGIVEGFLDDGDASNFPGQNILGRVELAREIHARYPDYRFIVGIGRNETRERIAEAYPELAYCSAIHPSAVTAEDCMIGAGTVIMANAVVNTGTHIGAHVIINTAATVDHDCEIDDFVHISPGAHVSGTVGVGKGAWLGVGACVVNNVNICERCTVGAGAAVIADLCESGTYVGVPAAKR